MEPAANLAVADTRRLAATYRGRPLRIVIINETYAENMGYAANCLSKAFVELGAETHVVTSTLPPYYYLKDFRKTYDEFLRPGAVRPLTTRVIDGYKVHYLDHAVTFGKPRLKGLAEKLAEIRPDIVQTFVAISWIPLDAARLKLRMGYKLFTGNSSPASVYPIAQENLPWWNHRRLKEVVLRSLHGRLVSLATEKCYCITADCAEIAWQYFGVERGKVVPVSLGVDTDIFHPCFSREERDAARRQLSYGPDDIVCIYTGRFTKEKDPLVLARAVEKLVDAGEPFKALFVGNGSQAEELALCRGAQIIGFKPFNELGGLFRSADIGVWPMQETTSQLDAAACGLPIIISDTLKITERIEGNGHVYRRGDVDDLARVLSALKPLERRRALGDRGAQRMAESFSWRSIARDRLHDYHSVLGHAI